jgi:hypothetical protein
VEHPSVETRLDELEASIVDLSIKLSATNWLLEQTMANLLLRDPRGANEFLGDLSHDDGRAFWPRDDAGPLPDWAKDRLYAQIRKLAEKVRVRVQSST